MGDCTAGSPCWSGPPVAAASPSLSSGCWNPYGGTQGGHRRPCSAVRSTVPGMRLSSRENRPADKTLSLSKKIYRDRKECKRRMAGRDATASIREIIRKHLPVPGRTWNVSNDIIRPARKMAPCKPSVHGEESPAMALRACSAGHCIFLPPCGKLSILAEPRETDT